MRSFKAFVRNALAILTSTTVVASPALSQTKTGVIVIAHGGGRAWNAGVIEAASIVRKTLPTEIAFLMGPDAATHRLQDQVAKLEKAGVQSIVVVPLLISSHSGHYEQIRWLVGSTDSLDATMQHHLHMSGIQRPKTKLPIRVSKGLDDASELADILSDRARKLATEPASRALLLLGHGPNSAEDYAAWMDNLRRVASRVQKTTGFRDVRVELVRDDAPAMVRAEAVTRARELVSLQVQLTGRDVVVVPILISRSSIGDEKIRKDLAGLPIAYSGDPLLPHPLIAEWIKRRALETAAQP